MKIGFSILSYLPPDPVYIRLLERLNDYPDARIAVHHDFYQAVFPKELAERLQVVFTEKHYRTYWSHINNVYATLETFKTLLEDPAVEWVFTLTPTDYPIKKPEAVIDFLSKARHDGYMDFREVNWKNPGSELDFYVTQDFKNPVKFKIPFFSKKLKYYKRDVRGKRKSADVPYFQRGNHYIHGSNWFLMSRKAVQHIVDASQDGQHAYYQFYEAFADKTEQHPCPQEIVFQNLLLDKPELDICPKNYRYINWDNHVNYHPNLLDMQYWEDLQKTDGLFARKFEVGKSDELLDKIDQCLLGC